MRRWVFLLVLLLGGCFNTYRSGISAADPDRPFKEWLYPLPVTRMMEKSLESIESLEGWTLIHLDPTGGIIECERVDWRQRDHILLKFESRPQDSAALSFDIDGEGRFMWPTDPLAAISEFYSALDRRIEVP